MKSYTQLRIIRKASFDGEVGDLLSNADIQKVLHAKGYSGEELVPMLVRTRLLLAVRDHIENRQWTQAQVAEQLDIKQPRVSEILNLHIEKFSTELLLKYARRLGLRVKLEISI